MICRENNPSRLANALCQRSVNQRQQSKPMLERWKASYQTASRGREAWVEQILRGGDARPTGQTRHGAVDHHDPLEGADGLDAVRERHVLVAGGSLCTV